MLLFDNDNNQTNNDEDVKYVAENKKRRGLQQNGSARGEYNREQYTINKPDNTE